jgi:hypothetical protein
MFPYFIEPSLHRSVASEKIIDHRQQTDTNAPLTPSLSPAGRGEGEGPQVMEINAFALTKLHKKTT